MQIFLNNDVINIRKAQLSDITFGVMSKYIDDTKPTSKDLYYLTLLKGSEILSDTNFDMDFQHLNERDMHEYEALSYELYCKTNNV